MVLSSPQVTTPSDTSSSGEALDLQSRFANVSGVNQAQLPQDNVQASLISPDGDSFIRGNVGCELFDTYEFVQGLTDLKMEDINRKKENINRKRLIIRERTNNLIKRQRKLLEQNGDSDVNLSSIINLNVGGNKMTVSRNLLTCLKGSRLEVLLSGRFENKILRDNEDNIFLDVDPDIFRRVIESLYLIKIANSDKNKLTIKDIHKDDDDLKLLVNFLFQEPKPSNDEILFFEDNNQLDKTSPQLNDTCNNLVTSIITKEEKLSLVIENKLKSIEEKLNAEESLIEFFLRSPEKNNDCGSSSIANKIVVLELLDGERISVKHSTLCLEENSVLAKRFNDEEWVKAHKSKEKNSGDVIITEQSGYFFKKMINRLRLISMVDSGCELPSISLKNMGEEEFFYKFVSNYFPGNEKLILGDERMGDDSLILETFEERNTILSWLPSIHKSSKPNLLYRATRDGWTASTFHSKCNNKGSSITVIKTDKGYVFGGYIDKAWSGSRTWIQSNEAFIFSLKCHANLPPTKMKINTNNKSAIFDNPEYGPTFGGGHDIHIASSSNTSEESYFNIGTTYDRPNDISDPNFLNGQRNFKVSEIEVFQV